MAKKLLLINPADSAKLNASAVRLFTLPPPSLAYLAALTPSDWDIKIIDENIEPITFEDADLVGITTMTSSAPRAYKISEQYRRKGIKTMMGGVHASMLSDEAIQFVDSVVIGEAESVWETLVHDFEKNELKQFYRGERISLEHLARPKNDLYSNRYRLKASVQTARGCPMDCEFCSVTTFHGRTYRQRPAEEVLDEIEALDCKEFFFSDDNILGYGKDAEERAIQLFRGMVERGLNKRWVSQVGIDFANNPEVLKWAQIAGCSAVLIGFESINDESLEGMHKVRNLKMGVSNYKEVARRIHDHGIRIDGAFVFGSDGDRKDVFQRTMEFILDARIDAAQLTILTPLPGTRLYDRLRSEGRLLHTNYPHDWKHYDLFEAVFRPKHMSPDKLEEGVGRVYERVASRLTSLRRALDLLVHTGSLDWYGAVVTYLWNRGYRSFWMKKYEHMKTGLSSGARDSCVSHPVRDG
ncbi:MAG: B12-binding domain-containing radical SAM protein, partial [Dehalococcoidia bacterium]|nr:B12-binding domain-containing radical SAM protein [Dehalococcoidia bacterium]